MRNYSYKTPRPAILCLALASIAVGVFRPFNIVSAQVLQPQLEEKELHRLGPKPEAVNAVSGMIAAFDRYSLVALGEDHGLQELYDFLDTLVRTPAFADKVNDIVVECGNARYQDVMDRYVAGGDVPPSEFQKIWRTSTQMPEITFDSPIYEHLFVTIREVNRGLSGNKQLRVLLGDPPIDWSQVSVVEQALPFLKDRDPHYARVVENEVLIKNRKALMIAGALHFQRTPDALKSHPLYHPPVTDILEQKYPGRILRVIPHLGFPLEIDPDRGMERRLKAYMASPWLALVKGTWLGKTGKLEVPDFIIPGGLVTYLEDRWDAVLYLGPGDQLTVTEVSPFFYASEQEYFREKNRIAVILFGAPLQAYEPHYISNVTPGIYLRDVPSALGLPKGVQRR